MRERQPNLKNNKYVEFKLQFFYRKRIKFKSELEKLVSAREKPYFTRTSENKKTHHNKLKI